MALRCLAPVLAAVALATAGLVRSDDAPPKGPAPWLFTVSKIHQGRVELAREPNSIAAYRPALKRLQFATAGGVALTEEELRRRVQAGSVVVVSSDGKPVDPAYLRVLGSNTIVLVGVVSRREPARKLAQGHLAAAVPEDGKPPVGGVITSQEEFNKLWKAWALNPAVQAVDFGKEVVVVVTSRQFIGQVHLVVDQEGDAQVAAERGGRMVPLGGKDKEVPGFQFAVVAFKRDGIKTIDGKLLAPQ
jgi:hypothetical protein